MPARRSWRGRERRQAFVSAAKLPSISTVFALVDPLLFFASVEGAAVSVASAASAPLSLLLSSFGALALGAFFSTGAASIDFPSPVEIWTTLKSVC